MSGNHFFKKQTLFLLVETHFPGSGTIFFHCLRYFSRSSSFRLVETHLSFQKKKYCLLLGTFFPASGNHNLDYREAHLKLLSLLLEIGIFFGFSDIPAIVSSFFV